MSVWKPGDVAMVRGCVSYLTLDGWRCEHGTNPPTARKPPRPLVVIDPESVGDLARLLDLVGKHGVTRTALREYANSTPRIEEPTGLGAVVQSADGLTFVRVAQHFDGWAKDRDWQRIGGELNAVRNFGWRDIDAVRVLSPGVTEAAS